MAITDTILIEPSILSADYTRLGDQVREAEGAGAESLQIDVMDGHFVPNLTFGPGIVRALRPLVRLPLDVHLMIDNPDSFLKPFADAGADRLIVHREACPDLADTLRSIHDLGMQAGVALSPDTDARALADILGQADVIQVMTVYPGFGGQKFLPSQLEKISRLREMLAAIGKDVPVAVDGGIDGETAPRVVAAGARVLVAGSAIYNTRGTVADNVAALRAAARSGLPPGRA